MGMEPPPNQVATVAAMLPYTALWPTNAWIPASTRDGALSVEDVVGNNDGTLSGTGTGWDSTGITLDGTSGQLVTLGTPATTTAWTAAIYCKITAHDASVTQLLCDVDDRFGLKYAVATETISFTYDPDGLGATESTIEAEVPEGSWRVFIVRADEAAGMTLFYGDDSDTQSIGSITEDFGVMQFGAASDGTSNRPEGSYAAIYWWGKSLTDAEVALVLDSPWLPVQARVSSGLRTMLWVGD